MQKNETNTNAQVIFNKMNTARSAFMKYGRRMCTSSIPPPPPPKELTTKMYLTIGGGLIGVSVGSTIAMLKARNRYMPMGVNLTNFEKLSILTSGGVIGGLVGGLSVLYWQVALGTVCAIAISEVVIRALD